jgi:hypothetical protein
LASCVFYLPADAISIITLSVLRYFGILLLCLICMPCLAGPARSRTLYNRYFPNKNCSPRAFEYAMRGYEILKKQGLLANTRYLSIIDFNRRSNQRRFFVLDLEARRTIISSITAHGIGSDPDSTTIPQQFSNTEGSKASSIGFYLTGNTYTNHRPPDSLGLCLFGLDEHFNDSAAYREIVIHYGATEYKGQVYVTDKGAARSYGCPALPLSTNTEVINTIKGGSCLFIYSSKVPGYLRASTVLKKNLPPVIRQQGPPPNNCSCDLQPIRGLD